MARAKSGKNNKSSNFDFSDIFDLPIHESIEPGEDLGKLSLTEIVLKELKKTSGKRIRTMREWAEQEIVIPTGPYAGTRWSIDRQPVLKHLYDEMESGRYNRVVIIGPSQSGKSLAGSIIPVLYHLFEREETVIFALPQMQLAYDKYFQDLLPVIEKTKYKELLPAHGQGSRGGRFEQIVFKNNATLKFMSGGAGTSTGDKRRAGFSSPSIVFTEVDGFDDIGTKSRETDKITQIEQRAASYGNQARIYYECTPSIESGRIWQEYLNSTNSNIYIKCQECGEYVLPDRRNLIGWEDAANEIEASETVWCCPSCGVVWSEKDRRRGIEQSKIVHKDQKIDKDGNITGDQPKTKTLGYRWSAVHNLFRSPSDYGVQLFRSHQRAKKTENYENYEREAAQFVFSIPYTPPELEITALDPHVIDLRRATHYPQGVVPSGTTHLGMGVDIGKYLIHWVLIAWMGDRGHIVDYAAQEVPSKTMSEEKAVSIALNILKNICEKKRWVTADGKRTLTPQQVWIDSGYLAPVIFDFSRSAGSRYLPIKGYGGQTRYSSSSGNYRPPTTKSKNTVKIGDGYHITAYQAERVHLAHIDTIVWKKYVHRRLSTPIDDAGSLTLPGTNEKYAHMEYSKSITAETEIEEYVKNKGNVKKWITKRSNKSHYLDATAYACCALNHLGASLDTAPSTSDIIDITPEDDVQPVDTKQLTKKKTKETSADIINAALPETDTKLLKPPKPRKILHRQPTRPGYRPPIVSTFRRR